MHEGTYLTQAASAALGRAVIYMIHAGYSTHSLACASIDVYMNEFLSRSVVVSNFLDAETVYIRTPTGPGGLAGPLRVDFRSGYVNMPYRHGLLKVDILSCDNPSMGSLARSGKLPHCLL